MLIPQKIRTFTFEHNPERSRISTVEASSRKIKNYKKIEIATTREDVACKDSHGVLLAKQIFGKVGKFGNNIVKRQSSIINILI